jgi:uncharacterized protein (DUF488 family)
MQRDNKDIWTIGHSTRSPEEFLSILKSFNIEVLIDIRTFPGSRRYPHFNKESLSESLAQNGIHYLHFIELGGRRKPLPDSVNTAWRHPSFRGYADHMQTPEFLKAISELQDIASSKRVAYMCSESMWWKCHRALVSDYLKAKGWNVQHIMDVNKSSEHPYTSPARAVQGNLFY